MPAAPTRTAAYHHGDLRNAVAQAALQALQDSGRAAFSLSGLARGLGVTPAAVYRHFADKDALVAALAGSGFAALAAAFERAAPRARPPQTAAQARLRLRRLAAAYHAFGCAHPALFRLMFGDAGRAHRAAGRDPQRVPDTYAYLVRALQDLHRLGAGERAPDERLAWLAWCLVHGATELAMAGTTAPRSSDDVGREVADAVQALLQAAPR